MQENQAVELYIHIPFCYKKCDYCDFLSFANKSSSIGAYLGALQRDIRHYKGLTISTIFIGGGTPSLMPPGFIQKLMNTIRECNTILPDAEITIEANPGTVDDTKLAEYICAGINRISFGLQTADEVELSAIGRIHTYSDFLESFEAARRAGFKNINVDLMMGLPGQTTISLKQTINKVCFLRPEHISAYMLILEEGTPLFERAKKLTILPNDDKQAEMYELAVSMLEKKGYQQYEISNFSREGFACKHNVGYWTRQPYLGIGLGASSLIDEKRYRVTTNLEQYLQELAYESEEELHFNDIRNELIMLGMRLKDGISYLDIKDQYGEAYANVLLQKLNKYIDMGLVEHKYDRFFFTVKGYLVSNSILSELMD